ncbi:hypothetical protein [Azospirillum sp.]|uniref:hypothetical protein n=1 Tax=Azospirillum sp. TaxID=34012 RepID=UPI003D74192F
MTTSDRQTALPSAQHASPLQRAIVRPIQILLIGLTALQFVALLVPPWAGPLGDLAAVLLALVIPPAVVRARRTTRVLFALLAAAVAAVTWAVGNPWPIWQGLHNAMLLGAFLCVLQLLRTIAHAGQAIREVRARLAPLDPRQVEGGFLVGAFGIGSFLSFGAHAVLAPLMRTDVQERGRREAALASVRGISFAAFWSPFFVGVAYVTHQMHDVSAGSVILLGLACAVLALAADLAVAGTGPRSLVRILYGLLPLVPISALIAAVFVAIMWLTGIGAMGAVVVGVPLLSAVLLVPMGREQAEPLLKTSLGGIVYGSDELLLVAAANIFAAVLTGLPGFAPTVAPLLVGLPPFPLLLAVIAIMLLAGALGLHPAISASVLLGVFGNLPDAVARLSLAEALIIGWSLAVTISPVGVTVMVASQMFHVPYPKLVFSRNLATALLVGAASAGLLALLDAAVR